MLNTQETRVRHRRKEERPAEIVAAGLAEFAERGFERTRLEDIAKRAGIAKGTIYLYFRNKEAVFEAAVEAHLEATLADVGALSQSFDGTTEELLRLILSRFYGQIAEGSASTILRTMVTEGPRFPELLKLYHERVITPAEAMMAGVLERGVARQEISAEAVPHYHRMIAAPAIMLSLWQILFAEIEPIDFDRYLDEHIALVMGGLRR
ncbi:MAG: TetR/AcrR family transcriptional regulator [Pseudomonadota bacterium]